MAKRWLKVEVVRELVSEVYLLIDDEKTPIKTQAIPGTKHQRVLISKEIRTLATAAAEDLDSLDWEEEDDISSVGPVKEVTQAEAEQYGVYDGTGIDQGEKA